MTAFTEIDVNHLLADLQLYSGNIRSIDGLYGLPSPTTNSFGGIIHTWMDSFGFSAFSALCDEESWTVQFADPAESLRRGHRSLTSFRFPKLHNNAILQERYSLANSLYKAYNSYSKITEADRLTPYEKALGYDGFPTCQHVLDAIVRDFRSFQEREIEDAKVNYTKN